MAVQFTQSSPKGHPGLNRPPNCHDHPQNKNCESPMLHGLIATA